jgi:DivIVA domain-containing protein
MAAGSDVDGKAPEAAVEGRAAPAMRAGEQNRDWEEAERTTQRFPKSRVSRGERDQMVKEAREVRFPVSVRGYERAAVDRYVQEVNRVIAELEISSSSEAAVRHALAEVSEETREILQRAHETADEIVLRARAKAAESVAEAEREADEIRNAAERDAIEERDKATHEAEELVGGSRRQAEELRASAEREATLSHKRAAQETKQLRGAAEAEADTVLRAATEKAEQLLKVAETRSRELVESADLIWRERRRLIEDLRVLGEQLLALGETEAERFARPTKTVAVGDPREPHAPEAGLVAELHAAVEGNKPAGDETETAS